MSDHLQEFKDVMEKAHVDYTKNSKPNFTPGPWKARTKGWRPYVEKESGVPLAEVWNHCIVSREQADANATLMSAAPEMYEALSRACSLCKTRRITNKSICDACYTHKALSKARGESEVEK